MKDLLQSRKIQGWIHDVESRDIVLVAQKPTRFVRVFFALTVFCRFFRLNDSMKVCTKFFFFSSAGSKRAIPSEQDVPISLARVANQNTWFA